MSSLAGFEMVSTCLISFLLGGIMLDEVRWLLVVASYFGFLKVLWKLELSRQWKSNLKVRSC